MISTLETFVLLSVASLYITHVPFHKVEESFNTQAIHDIINIFPNNLPTIYNATNVIDSDLADKNPSQTLEIAHRSHLPWDHTQYPGVVPRTFIGAFLVGLPLNFINTHFMHGLFADEQQIKYEHDLGDQFILHLASRFVLLSFVTISLGVMMAAVRRRYGQEYKLTFLLISLSQYHYLYYASRLLPNTFAAILSNLVFASWINRQYSKSIIYIAFCVIIFRFDTAIFFGWLLIDGVFIRQFLSLSRVIMVGLPAGFIAIAITFTVDSIFWARPVWPEMESFYFNAWLNKSHEWGTEPFFWYIYNCIPRMMLAFCVPMILADNRITRDYFIPVLAFIFTYSFLPHKELRFILFTLPLLNLCATSGLVNMRYYMDKFCQYLDRRCEEPMKKETLARSRLKKTEARNPLSLKRKCAFILYILIIIVCFVIPNLLGCFVLFRVASFNYPGGQAALSLGVTKELLDEAKTSLESGEYSKLKDVRSDVAVYVNNLAAQTGVSRFLQVDGVYYSKVPQINATTFTRGYKLIYLILEPKEIPDFLKANCASSKNIKKIMEKGVAHWSRTNNEISCLIPNQSEMQCSIVDTISSFSSINMGAFLRNLRQARSIQSLYSAFEDGSYMKLRAALHIIRCGTTSKTVSL